MATIDKKLIHFKTKSAFENALANDQLNDWSIVFIKETQEIWTHGQLYSCSPQSEVIPADEEDITSVNDKLQFKDKDYDSANFSGLGRVYLRKNIVDNKNVLTQDMINTANTIYIIQYDYDLNDATITVPEGCVLNFQGGSFSNGELIVNNTGINNANNIIIFYNIELHGTIDKNVKFYDNWTYEDVFISTITSLSCLVLTKDHHIIDKESYIYHSINQEEFTIEGNNHTIYFDSDDYTSKEIFIECKKLIVKDTNFEVINNSNKTEVISTIFNCRSAELYNVYYKGYNRFICNWTYATPNDDTYIKIINSNLYTTSFLIEYNFSNIYIESSTISAIRGLSTEYQHKIISVVAIRDKQYDSIITINNSNIFGGIEFNTITYEDEVYGFSEVNLNNCNLEAFTVSTYDDKRVDFDLTVNYYNCNIIKYLTNNHINAVSSNIFYFCNIILRQNIDIYTEYPFLVDSLTELKFIGCHFYIEDISSTNRVDIVMISTLFGNNNIKVYFIDNTFSVYCNNFNGEVILVNAANSSVFTLDYIKENFIISGNRLYYSNDLPYTYLKILAQFNNYVIVPSSNMKLDGMQSFKNFELLQNSSADLIDTTQNNQRGYFSDTINLFLEQKRNTSERPVFTNGRNIGYIYFDATINKPVWWNGYEWIDITNTSNIEWELIE